MFYIDLDVRVSCTLATCIVHHCIWRLIFKLYCRLDRCASKSLLASLLGWGCLRHMVVACSFCLQQASCTCNKYHHVTSACFALGSVCVHGSGGAHHPWASDHLGTLGIT
jgi:hypothetical protein